jgi:hypothetical protein
VITASEPSWIAPFTGLSPRLFGKLVTVLRRERADRIIDHLGPMLALQPRKRFAKGTVLIVDGTLVPTRDHAVAEQSKNYRYSTNHQVVIDADTRLVVVVGRPLPGDRNDCKAWEESGRRTPSAGPRRSPTAAIRARARDAPPATQGRGTVRVEAGPQGVPQTGPRPR